MGGQDARLKADSVAGPALVKKLGVQRLVLEPETERVSLHGCLPTMLLHRRIGWGFRLWRKNCLT
jgi:hypothetical protein